MTAPLVARAGAGTTMNIFSELRMNPIKVRGRGSRASPNSSL
jgi:hypothetical protein